MSGKLYYKDYLKKYCKRRLSSYEKCFEYIKNIVTDKTFNIVELGTMRMFYNQKKKSLTLNSDELENWNKDPDFFPWNGGCFTKVFSESFKNNDQIKIHTIDPSADAIKVSRNYCKENNNVFFYNMTAFEFLKKIDFKIDFLYMDHGDSGEETCKLHLKDIKFVIQNNLLSEKAIVLNDDAIGQKIKTRLSVPFLKKMGFETIHEGFQVLLKKT